MTPTPRRLALVAVALLATLAGADVLIARHPAQGREPRAVPGISVRSVLAQRHDVPLVVSTPGTVTPLDSVEIRAQAAATVAKVHVHEGQFVHAGDLLFTLDARSAQAAELGVRAQLARDTATLADGQRQLQRNRDLLAQGFISQAVVDTSLSQVQAQEAALQADRAQLSAAGVGMSFTRIAAPVSGRLGAINISTGSLVQPTAATPMVTVTRLDPIEVSFALPQRQLGDALAALQSGRAAAEIALGDGAAKKQPPRHGTLSFVDSTVDAATGTVKVKARFDNADQALWPGAFVDVKFAARTLPDAVTVPQAALIAGEDGVSLYTIDDQGLARKQKVQRVAAVGDEAVVQGLDAGQRVVVDGKQNVTPGVKVNERVSERKAEAGNARPAAPGASAAGKPQDPA